MRRPLLTTAIAVAVMLTTGCASSPPVERTPYAEYTPPTAAWPTPTPKMPSPTPTAATLTDAQRATLDATFGRSLGKTGPLGTYCPMDAAGRSYYADLVARQFEGYTPAVVLLYLDEACATLPA